MEVFKKTISGVFGGERRYAIPLFQRPYVWTRELQWEPLWDDIVARAELEVAEPQRDLPPHFLGAIVTQLRQVWGDELLAHDVIDGQQRLTTFQILLFAFRDVYARTGDDKQIAASLLSWTKNATASTEPEELKVCPTARDIQQFQLVASAGSREQIEVVHPPVFRRKRLQERPRMIEAYLFFHEQILEWLKPTASASALDRAKALRRVLDRRMQLVSIELEKQEEPQAIFETLNARGVPLLASDLLRNYIFQRAAGSADALHKKYWQRFEIPDDANVPDGARFWEVEQRQGRLSRARLDLFVQHYVTMKRCSEVLSGRLFHEYKEWIEKEAQFSSIEEELRDFTTYADHFFALLRPSAETAVGRFAERLHVLDTSTVYPLVLALLGNPGLPAAEREEILVDLESFLVRRLVCGRPSNNYNRLFLQVLRDFATKPPTRAEFRALLAAGTGETVDWPDDVSFGKAWATVDAYRELKPARVEMMLRAIDRSMTRAANESITIHGKLSVEHVLPQKWQTHWPLPTNIDAEVAAEHREELVHDFGNLTLLTQPLNSEVSNGPAQQKLPKIALNSALRLSSYFQSRTEWTEEDIEKRSEVLLAHAKKVWPPP